LKLKIGESVLELVQGDITEMETDSIVNAANACSPDGGRSGLNLRGVTCSLQIVKRSASGSASINALYSPFNGEDCAENDVTRSPSPVGERGQSSYFPTKTLRRRV
jgi:hypothetical protein